MATVFIDEPGFQDAIASCRSVLNRLVEYQLESGMMQRLNELSDRKEFLNSEEHAELMALVDFSEHRTIEGLAAKVALRQLNQVLSTLQSPS